MRGTMQAACFEALHCGASARTHVSPFVAAPSIWAPHTNLQTLP